MVHHESLKKTKPIWGKVEEVGRDAQPTKSRRAKQSQSAHGRAGPALGPSCKTKPISREWAAETIAKAGSLDNATRPARTRILRNKANLPMGRHSRRQSCETKPIVPRVRKWARTGRREGALLRTDVRNKANSWDRVGRLTLPGQIGYNDTHADGFLFGRGDTAGWGARKGWRESP